MVTTIKDSKGFMGKLLGLAMSQSHRNKMAAQRAALSLFGINECSEKEVEKTAHSQ